MSEGKQLLTDKAARQEHLLDLNEWLNVQTNVWAREYKNHRSPDDKLKLAVYEAATALLTGYIDSFTKSVVTDVDEPKIERERLGTVDTRYNHLVKLLEMWRDAAQFVRDHHVGKNLPTADLNKIRMFDKTVEIVEIYQESLAGEFDYPGVSRPYPSFKDGQARFLRPVCDDAYKTGVAANKQRLLDAANEKAEREKAAEEDATLAEGKGQVPSKNEEDEPRVPDDQGTPGSGQVDRDDEPGFSFT